MSARTPGLARATPPRAPASVSRSRLRSGPRSARTATKTPAPGPSRLELSRENEALRSELRDARDWRARATEYMASSAPRREAMAKARLAAKEKRQQLEKRQGLAAKRAALQRRLTELEDERSALHRQIASLENSRASSELARQQEAYEHSLTQQRVGALEKVFTLHLERLAARRLQDETRHSGEPGPSPQEVEETVRMWVRVAEKSHGDSRVAALASVAQESADWVEARAQQWAVREAELVDALAQESKLLAAARERLAERETEAQKLGHALQLEQGVNEGLEKLGETRAQEQRILTEKLERAEAAGERARAMVRGLTDELQDYLMLVRAEVKKKFGYLPQTLLHAPVLHVPVAL